MSGQVYGLIPGVQRASSMVNRGSGLNRSEEKQYWRRLEFLVRKS